MSSIFLLKVLETAIGMNKNLGVPINPLIKLLVRNFRFVNVDLMRDDKTGLGSA